LALAYGVSGQHGVSSRCGLSGAAPNTAPDAATSTRMSGLRSRTASRRVAVAGDRCQCLRRPEPRLRHKTTGPPAGRAHAGARLPRPSAGRLGRAGRQQRPRSGLGGARRPRAVPPADDGPCQSPRSRGRATTRRETSRPGRLHRLPRLPRLSFDSHSQRWTVRGWVRSARRR
jgi:hypothetical protein